MTKSEKYDALWAIPKYGVKYVIFVKPRRKEAWIPTRADLRAFIEEKILERPITERELQRIMNGDLVDFYAEVEKMKGGK